MLCIEVDSHTVGSVEQAVTEMIEFAKKTGCFVKTNYDGVKVCVHGNSDKEEDIKLAESKTLTIRYPAHKFGFTNQRWDWNCDEFLVVEFLTPDEEDEDKAFLCAKTSTGEWSMITGAFTLDIESKWRESCISNWMQCARENGEKMVYNKSTELWDYVPLDKKES